MKRQNTIHRENCDPLVKDAIKVLGATYILCGRYAYEWKIIVDEGHKKFTIEFKNRIEARKEWEKKKKLVK